MIGHGDLRLIRIIILSCVPVQPDQLLRKKENLHGKNKHSRAIWISCI